MGGDTAAPEGPFSRRQGLEPGLTRAMVPCSWLAILWDAWSTREKGQVNGSAAHPGLEGASPGRDAALHHCEVL